MNVKAEWGRSAPPWYWRGRDRWLLGCLSLSVLGTGMYVWAYAQTPKPELRAFPSQGGTTYISTVHKLRSILSLLSFYRLFIQSQNLRHPQQNTEGMLSVFPEHVGTMSLIGRFVQVRFPEGSSSHSFWCSSHQELVWKHARTCWVEGGCTGPWDQFLCLTFTVVSGGTKTFYILSLS